MEEVNLRVKCRKCWNIFSVTIKETPATRRCPECLTENIIKYSPMLQ